MNEKVVTRKRRKGNTMKNVILIQGQTKQEQTIVAINATKTEIEAYRLQARICGQKIFYRTFWEDNMIKEQVALS